MGCRAQRLYLFLLVAVVFLSMKLDAQTAISGGLTGVVADPSGAALQNADVEIKQISKGTTRSTRTNRDGVYRFFFLAPDQYLVTVIAPGFEVANRTVTVSVRQTTSVDFMLKVGSAKSTVEVKADAPLLQTENADGATVFHASQIADLPNPGNDLTNVAQTSPGAVMNTQKTGMGGSGNFSTYGLPATSNLFMLSGLISGLRFAPDGKELAFTAGPGFSSSDIYVASVSGGKARALTSLRSRMWGVDWTPDRRELVFSSDHQGPQNLYRISRAGGDPQPLSIAADNAISPRIAPHGHRLLFLHYLVDTNIWRAPLSPTDHGAPSRIIASTRQDSGPAFSPDGDRLAFGSDRAGSSEIYISAADGSNPVQLTSMKTGTTGSPAWSADGKQIAFDSRANGQGDIYVISAEGGSPRRLTKGPYDSEIPTWSRDGRWIYFTLTSPGTPIWKVSPQGGDPIPVTKTGGMRAIEGKDGHSFYYFRDGAVWKNDLLEERKPA